MATIGQIIRAERRRRGLTLQQVADTARCAKSYLSTIENDRRASPPSQDLLARIEAALNLETGRLTSLGTWASTPREVKRAVHELEAQSHVARRLATLVRKGGLDKAYRSGELHRLVGKLAPDADEHDVGAQPAGDAAVHPAVAEPAAASSASRSTGPSAGPSAHAAAAAAMGRVVGMPRGGLVALNDLLPMQVPVINKVQAGYPREFTDLGYPACIADEYVAVPGLSDADAFAARVVGDSMEPDYREGDIVVFSPQVDASPGSDCFARLERDDETTFKRVYFERSPAGDELIRLQPLNSAYAPRVLPREEVSGLYKAVYVVRRV